MREKLVFILVSFVLFSLVDLKSVNAGYCTGGSVAESWSCTSGPICTGIFANTCDCYSNKTWVCVNPKSPNPDCTKQTKYSDCMGISASSSYRVSPLICSSCYWIEPPPGGEEPTPQPTPTPIPAQTKWHCFSCDGQVGCNLGRDNPIGDGCVSYDANDVNADNAAEIKCDENKTNTCPAPTTAPPTSTPIPVATSTPVPTAIPTATPRADQWLYCPKVDFIKSDGTPVKAGYCAFTSGGYADQNSCQTALQTSLSGKTTDTCYPSTSTGVDACNTACTAYRPGGPTPIGATSTPKPTAAPICRVDRP